MVVELLKGAGEFTRPVTKRSGVGLAQLTAIEYAKKHNAIVLVRPVGSGLWQGWQKRSNPGGRRTPQGYDWLCTGRRARRLPVVEPGGRVLKCVPLRTATGQMLVEVVHPKTEERVRVEEDEAGSDRCAAEPY